jgi:hypothetical protein
MFHRLYGKPTQAPGRKPGLVGVEVKAVLLKLGLLTYNSSSHVPIVYDTQEVVPWRRNL